MERSARVYRRSAEKLARFFRARKRMSDVIGAAFIFFFPYPSNPNWVTFSIRPSIDRSIDPRREIVCRIETAALRRFLCAVYLRAKRKAPAGNRVNKCWGLRVWIRIYAWGWMSVRAGNATTHRSRSSRTRDVFFPGYERCSTVFDGMSRIRGGGGGRLSATFGDFDEFRLGNRWGMKRPFQRALEFWKSWTILSRWIS